ncbi:hypothetical protein DFH06DRAFT_1316483 [Mycena polygramma]|nr:hypothetical protein DFH06DRAFT_1316483 [Mycena polygramma]
MTISLRARAPGDLASSCRRPLCSRNDANPKSKFLQGTFYEGVMTSHDLGLATENTKQPDVVSAQYATASLTAAPPPRDARTASSRTRATTSTRRFGDSQQLKLSASWNVRAAFSAGSRSSRAIPRQLPAPCHI